MIKYTTPTKPLNGCDLSEWQRSIDIAKLKVAGLDFAILRIGYTGYGPARTKQPDAAFASLYDQALACKLPVGGYWYSCANTAVDGRVEARKCLDTLGRRDIAYPIYIDVEDNTWQTADPAGVTDAVIAFCQVVEAAGHAAGVYASLDWFNNHLQTSRLDAYTKWVAAWGAANPKANQPGWHMWQHTNKMRVAGCDIDGNIAYPGLPIKTSTTTPAAQPQPAAPRTVSVRAGDTLSGIAAAHGTTWQHLAQLNQLANPDLIYPGQVLRLV